MWAQTDVTSRHGGASYMMLCLKSLLSVFCSISTIR